jgi:hypothetical protein
VTNPTPSKAEITVTKAVAQAAALFDIALHDHPIIGRGGADLWSKHLKTVLNPAFRQKGPSLVLGLEIPEVAAGSTDRPERGKPRRAYR